MAALALDRHYGARTPLEDLDIEAIRDWKLYTFDLQTAWDHAKHAFASTIQNVRLSDEAVFAVTVFMPASLRAKYYRYDFDSRGDIREYRIPRDPPMVIQCHGINWFPVYRMTNILCGSWSKAFGWLRGIVVSEDVGYHIGEIVAPPEAAKACSSPLQLNSHKLKDTSGISPDSLLLTKDVPSTLLKAIARQGIYLTMEVNIPNVIVIDSKDTFAFQSLLDIEGFHFLAGPHSDPKDPIEAIQQPVSSKKNIEGNMAEKYGGPYKNITSIGPLKRSERQAKDADSMD